MWVGKVTARTRRARHSPTQFLSCGVQRVIDGVRLGEFLVERMFATCRQRQCNSSMSGEVTDEFEVIVAEWRLLRVAGDSDHTKHRVVGDQRHDDRRASPTSVLLGNAMHADVPIDAPARRAESWAFLLP